MKTRNFTRQELTDAVCRKIGLPRTEAYEMVASVLDVIAERLGQGEGVLLTGFASFRVLSQRPRPGRNPITGEEVIIPPLRLISFKGSTSMKYKIQQAHLSRLKKPKQT